jgi:integrase
MVKDNTHHLFLRGNTWMIRIQVPKDLQAHYGKRELLLSTKRKAHQLEEAILIRDQELAAFKVQRYTLRTGGTGAIPPLVREDAEEWAKITRDQNRMHKDDPEQEGAEEEKYLLMEDVLDKAVEEFVDGGWQAVNEEASRTRTTDQWEAIRSLDPKAYQNVIKRLDVVRGKTFDAHLERYIKQRSVSELTLKYQDEIKKTIKEFATENNHTDAISRFTVNDWKEQLERDGLASSTIGKRLGMLSKYWEYLETIDAIDPKAHSNPFAGHKITKKIKHIREMFTVEEAKQLTEEGSGLIVDFIKLGLLTGCRMKELCSIKVSDLTTFDNVRIIRISEEMTKGRSDGNISSGVRNVPITSKMEPILDQLVAHQKERKCHPTQRNKGYLFDTGYTQYKDLTGPMSKRFTRHKTALGFKANVKVAHCFRHTANNLLGRSNVDPVKRAALLGWVEGADKNLMANQQYGDQSFIYSMSKRKQDLEILCDSFWFI